MKKKIVKIGNSQGIYFTKNEMEIYGIRINDILDLGDMIIQKSKGGKKK